MNTHRLHLQFPRWAVVVLSLLVGGASPAWAHGANSHHSHAADQGHVTAHNLNVRSGPGTRYTRIGVLHRGDPVEVVSRSGNWYQIRGSRGTGWVSGSYISIRPSPGYRDRYRHSYRTRARFAVVSPRRYGFANMFDGPGRRYHVVAQLPAGVRVRIIEYGRKWSLIGKRGLGRGYIRTRFLHSL